SRPVVGTQYGATRQPPGDRLAVRLLSPDDDQVADASLGELALDRRHPGTACAPVGSGRVQEDAGIAHELAAVGPLAPLVLDDQVIIAVLPVGGDVSVAIAGSVEGAVGGPEHPAGTG